MHKENKTELKDRLERLYIHYKRKFSSKDPVWILHRFGGEKNIEIIGLLTSVYSYGQVDLINKFIEKLLVRIGNKPHEFTINFEKRKDKKRLEGLNYRFNTDEDLVRLFERLNAVLVNYGSLRNLFLSHWRGDTELALAGFMKKLRNGIHSQTGVWERGEMRRPFDSAQRDKASGRSQTGVWERGFERGFELIPDPGKRSTCKRMNLFLRWMVRKDEIDLGVWGDDNKQPPLSPFFKGESKLDKSKLIMPVDVHIGRISKKLGLVRRGTVDMKFAVELTERLREFDSEDPVKYDFALCHAGMEKKFI